MVVDDKLWKCCIGGGGEECADTVCATHDLPRRKVVLEANGHGGNPCSPDTSNEENDPRTAIDVSSDGASITLHGNNAACLTLAMNGNFFSDALDVDCSGLDLCSIPRKKAGNLSGDVARRLRNVLSLGEAGGPFVAKDEHHEVSIGCDEDCAVVVK